MHALRVKLVAVNVRVPVAKKRVDSQLQVKIGNSIVVVCSRHRLQTIKRRTAALLQLKQLLVIIFSAHPTLLQRTLAVDVGLSVCLTKAWIVTKRNNSLSMYQRRTIERFF